MNPSARGAGTARQIRDNPPFLTRTTSIYILENDIRNVHFAWVRRARRLVDVEIALIEHNGIIGVLDMYVFIRYVVDVAVADVGAGPGFETCTVLAVEERDVGDVGVGNVIFDAGVLADTAH